MSQQTVLSPTEKLILALQQGKPVPAMLKDYARPVFVDGYCKEEGFFVYPDYTGVHEGRIAFPDCHYHAPITERDYE